MAAPLAETGCVFCGKFASKISSFTRLPFRQSLQTILRYRTRYTHDEPAPVTNLIFHRPFTHTNHPSPCTNAKSELVSVKPHMLVKNELGRLHDSIKRELDTTKAGLRSISHYHFDGKGKSFRPMLTMILSKALNFNKDGRNDHVLPGQEKIAQITEMIHVASLIHDDVIDASHVRRGIPTVHQSWNHTKAVVAGNYVLSAASAAIARLGNSRVITILSRVVDDLVRGEFMQLGSKENEDERFAHYLEKTYKKTASLMANSCHSIAVLNDCGPEIEDTAYHIGRNIGIAFQLVDDLLDFVSSDLMMGKPAAADLKLGLATGPVLFACQKYPDLHAMIMRRFSRDGDVERARKFVEQSDGLHQTRLLAQAHCQDALKLIATQEILLSIACWTGGFVFFIILVLVMVICQQLRMRSRGEGIWGKKMRRQDATKRRYGEPDAVPEIHIFSPQTTVPNQTSLEAAEIYMSKPNNNT